MQSGDPESNPRRAYPVIGALAGKLIFIWYIVILAVVRGLPDDRLSILGVFFLLTGLGYGIGFLFFPFDERSQIFKYAIIVKPAGLQVFGGLYLILRNHDGLGPVALFFGALAFLSIPFGWLLYSIGFSRWKKSAQSNKSPNCRASHP